MRRSRDKRIEELEQEVAAHRAAIEELARVARAAAQGNLEERIHELPAVAGFDLSGLRADLNRLIDVTDGFCREASASLLAASSGQHERQLLVRGLPGQFRDHAMSINGARAVIADKDDELATNDSARRGFAAEFERDVLETTQRVGAVAGEVTEIVQTVVRSTQQVVEETGRANEVMSRLTESAEVIGGVIGLITDVAGQTRLLALNATIEAARAGEAGKGFAVVADEVGRLAEETRTASGRIESQLEESRNMIQETASALSRIDSDANSMRRDVDGLHEHIVGPDGSAQSGAGLTASVASLEAQVRRFLTLLSDS